MKVFNIQEIPRISKGIFSIGTQEKWYDSREDVFIKEDTVGYESISECLTSELLRYIKGIRFVDYYLCKIVVENKEYSGCYSYNLLKPTEQLHSFAHLTRLKYGGSTNRIKAYGVENVHDVKGFYLAVISDVSERTQIPPKYIRSYIDLIMVLDYIFLNEDRHLGNIAMIYDTIRKKYKFSPIFDNGRSLLADTSAFPMFMNTDELVNCVQANPFSYSFDSQLKCIESFNPLKIDIKGFMSSVYSFKPPFMINEYYRAVDVLVGQLKKTKGVYWNEI